MRYIIGLFFTLGLIILILVLIFRGGATPPKHQINLGSYLNSGGTAQLIIDGPITAESEHAEVQIDVSPDQVSFTLYQGYQQTVATQQTYPNNQSAYAVFLQALQHAGFTNGTTSGSSDERGYCPAGNRYIYSFMNEGDQLTRFWYTSCGNGNFRGSGDTIRWLFRQQVPDYDKLTLNKNING